MTSKHFSKELDLMPVTETKKKKSPTMKKKKKPIGKPAKEESKSEISKAELIDSLAKDYNTLLLKINMHPISAGRELQLAATKLEESFLWFRAAVEKADA
jgi:hypothetical protein